MNEKISIAPRLSKSVFAKNSMDFTSLVKELIDNPAAEMVNTPNGFVTRVDVIIRANWDAGSIVDLKSAKIIIKDNSVGIKRDKLSSCLSIGKEEYNSEQPHSLHEHGFGLKIAVWSLGDLEYIITKDKSEKVSTKVTDLPTEGDLSIFDDNLFSENESGTVVSITNLNKEKVSSILRRCDISMWVVPYLSAVYSRLLVTNQMNKKRLEISIVLQDLKDDEVARWNLEPTEMYWRNNKIDLRRKDITDKDQNYCADFNLGIAASDAEYLENSQDTRGKNHPFHPWNKKISIYINDRMICRKSLEDLINPHVNDGLKISGNYMVPYQGEIFLRKGFKTNLFKNDIETDANYIDFIKKIAKSAKDFITSEANRTQKLLKQEKDLREQLVKMWIGAGCYCDVHRKVPICNGEIDIVRYNKPREEIDFEKDLGLVCELKGEEAKALDCYQILMYLENSKGIGIYDNKAWLIAPSFSQGCKNIVQEFEKKKIKITMKTFSDVNLDNSSRKTRKKKLKTVNL